MCLLLTWNTRSLAKLMERLSTNSFIDLLIFTCIWFSGFCNHTASQASVEAATYYTSLEHKTTIDCIFWTPRKHITNKLKHVFGGTSLSLIITPVTISVPYHLPYLATSVIRKSESIITCSFDIPWYSLSNYQVRLLRFVHELTY